MPYTPPFYDEFVIWKGESKYTGNFTPPTVPWALDEGTSAGARYYGSGPFGDQSAYTSVSYAELSAAGLDISKGNFTIEGLFRIDSKFQFQAGDPTPRYAIMGQYEDTLYDASSGIPQGNWWSLEYLPSDTTEYFRFRVWDAAKSAYVVDIAVPVTINWEAVWTDYKKDNQDAGYIHFAVVKNGVAIRIFIDGDYQDITASASDWDTIAKAIEINGQDGRKTDGIPYGITYVDQLRIFTGVLYWDDFIPSSNFFEPSGIFVFPRIFPYMMKGFPGDAYATIGVGVNLGSPASLFNFGSLCPGIVTSLPMMQFQATGVDSETGVGTWRKPAFTFSGEGQVNPIGRFADRLPMLLFGAEANAGATGSIGKSLPRFILRASGVMNAVGTLSCNFPSLAFAGTLINGVTGTITLTLPALRALFLGLSEIRGTMAVSLPLFLASFRDLPATYLNMVMNLRNLALTEYNNYNFNSMCRFVGKHLGATATGIYDLDLGASDAGDQIEWNFRTGYLDLHQREKKRLKQAWLSYSSNGDLIVTAVLPDGTSYEYEIDSVEVTENGMRVKFGKGIRSKYIALDVKNVGGSTIELDVIKLNFDKWKKMR